MRRTIVITVTSSWQRITRLCIFLFLQEANPEKRPALYSDDYRAVQQNTNHIYLVQGDHVCIPAPQFRIHHLFSSSIVVLCHGHLLRRTALDCYRGKIMN